jgi:hypothetical protein
MFESDEKESEPAGQSQRKALIDIAERYELPKNLLLQAVDNFRQHAAALATFPDIKEADAALPRIVDAAKTLEKAIDEAPPHVLRAINESRPEVPNLSGLEPLAPGNLQLKWLSRNLPTFRDRLDRLLANPKRGIPRGRARSGRTYVMTGAPAYLARELDDLWRATGRKAPRALQDNEPGYPGPTEGLAFITAVIALLTRDSRNHLWSLLAEHLKLHHSGRKEKSLPKRPL